MSKLEDARAILKALDMPLRQQNDMCCYSLLALCCISENEKWIDAKSQWLRIHDIMIFIRESYGITYAENSRETFRKVAMHNFRNAALIVDNGKATNSPAYRYRITDEALSVINKYGTDEWDRALEKFKRNHMSLIDMYSSKKEVTKKPVLINGFEYLFSSGKHNELQKAILEEFAPRFAENSMCLYVGDSAERDLYKNEDKLRELGFEITLHDKMPDVVLYREDKDWIYFIEAVTSVGPMSPKRIVEIIAMTEHVKSGKVFVTAFPDFKTFKSFSEQLAWETEIWISELPEHMIHMNGDKFLGPR